MQTKTKNHHMFILGVAIYLATLPLVSGQEPL